MEILDSKRVRVCYGTAVEVLRSPLNAEYVIAKTDHLHTQEIAELQAAGYVFHERFLKVSFNIKTALDRIGEGSADRDITILETREFTDRMLCLACSAYSTDRRFHLEPGFDDGGTAAELIIATARQYEGRQARIITAVHGEEMLGYCTFLPCGNDHYNAMGLTARNIKGKLAAWPLYTGALRRLKTGGYIGRISASNVASLNLHIRLGARVTGTEDWYILRRNRGACPPGGN